MPVSTVTLFPVAALHPLAICMARAVQTIIMVERTPISARSKDPHLNTQRTRAYAAFWHAHSTLFWKAAEIETLEQARFLLGLFANAEPLFGESKIEIMLRFATEDGMPEGTTLSQVASALPEMQPPAEDATDDEITTQQLLAERMTAELAEHIEDDIAAICATPVDAEYMPDLLAAISATPITVAPQLAAKLLFHLGDYPNLCLSFAGPYLVENAAILTKRNRFEDRWPVELPYVDLLHAKAPESAADQPSPEESAPAEAPAAPAEPSTLTNHSAPTPAPRRSWRDVAPLATNQSLAQSAAAARTRAVSGLVARAANTPRTPLARPSQQEQTQSPNQDREM